MSAATSYNAVQLMERDLCRKAWLEWRRGGIGSSDAAAILGLSRYNTPLGVYLDKIGESDDEPANIPQRVGLALEDLIAEMYEEETGRSVVEKQVQGECSSMPYLRATIDGIDSDGNIVEFKTTTNKGKEIGDEGSDEIPTEWIIQTHVQMIVNGSRMAYVAVLESNRKFTIHRVEYDVDLADSICHAVAMFWQSHVLPRIPPPPSSGSDCSLLSRAFPECEGSINFDAQSRIVAEYLAANEAKKAATERADMLKAELLYALGSNSEGHLSSGSIVKKSLIQVKERTQIVKAHTQTRLTVKDHTR